MASDSKKPTSPPPFDPEEYARNSEAVLRASSDPKRTRQIAPPPLNRPVRLAVPKSDLAWFDLSPEAASLVERMDGTRTLLELMEGDETPDLLRAVAELHDAKLLEYD